MKRYAAGLLAFLCILMLAACKTAEQKEAEHQQALQASEESAKQRREQWRAFADSTLYATGTAYLESVLKELALGCTLELDLEPNASWYQSPLSEEALSTSVSDTETARLCFADMYTTVYIDYWNHNVEPETLCKALLENGVGGRLMAAEKGGDAWQLNAENGTYEFYRAPEA